MNRFMRQFRDGLTALGRNLAGKKASERRTREAPTPPPDRVRPSPFKRVLKGTAKGLGILLAVVVAALVVVVWRPEWFLRPPTLAKLVKKFGADYHPDWKDFELAIHSRSFLRKRVTLRSDDFCFHDSSGAMKGCFDRIDADLTVKLGLSPELAEVDHLDASSRSLFLDDSRPAPAPAKKKKSAPIESLDDLVPAPLRHGRLREVNVRLRDFKVVLPSTSTVDGDLVVTFSTAQSPPLAVRAQLYWDTPDKAENLDARLGVTSDLFTKGDLSFLRAQGRVRGDVEDSAAFDARIDDKGQRKLELTARAKVINGERTLRADLSGDKTDEALRARFSATLDDSSSTIRSVAVRSCDADAPLGKKGRIKALKVACKVLVQPAAMGSAPGKAPKPLVATLGFDAKKKRGHRFEGKLTARVEPIKDWFQFSGSLRADLAGQLDDLPRSLKAKHELSADLSVPKFEKLVAYLKDTPYAVPAPLHVLNGPVKASLTSRGDTTGPDQTFSYTASTDLTSGRQKVLVRVEGKLLAKQLFTPGRKLEDKTDVRLQTVALELPYLKLGAAPSVRVDPRIHTGEEPAAKQEKQARERQAAEEGRTTVEKSTPTNLTYTAHVVTVDPILLYSNLNPTPIPVGVDVTATVAGASGTITVEKFTAELFRRKADIDHVTLRMDPGASAMNLDGLIEVPMPDADISVKLLGSTEKPQVVFESDPPMNQQDIVAMLLFGQAPDNLDPDQKTTASNSQSAMASGAFGLASLYLFASTPIQYVGYDPATQTYAMKFKLPGGASLEVGSGAQEEGHLTLRKRLARHWVIETQAQRGGGTQPGGSGAQQNAVTTFLEWFQRY